MSKDSLYNIITSDSIQDSSIRIVTDSIATMKKELKGEIISNSNNIIESLDTIWYKDISVLATIAFGAIGFIFFLVARKQAQKANQLINRLNKQSENIGIQSKNIGIEVELLRDINRPFLKTFPEMMKRLNDLFQTVLSNPENSELYIMNRTSAFGKIHMYNPKFYNQYNLKDIDELNVQQKEILEKMYHQENDILSDLENINDKCKYLFHEDVRLLYEKVEECSKTLPNDKFKLIVFPADEEKMLQEKFIKDYFSKVNSDNDVKENIGLEYFEYIPRPHKGKASIKTENCKTDLSKKSKIEEKILNKVVEVHNKVLKSVKTGKPNTNENLWICKSSGIPMQMYLLKTVDNAVEQYHTLIINAMDTSKNENKDRDIDGLFSREESLYKVFKTIFDDNFKTNTIK